MKVTQFKNNVLFLIALCEKSEANGSKPTGICELVRELEDSSFYTENKIKSYIKTIKWLFLFRDYVITDINSYYYNTNFRTNNKKRLFILKYLDNYDEIFYKETIQIRISFLRKILELDNNKIIETFRNHKDSLRI